MYSKRTADRLRWWPGCTGNNEAPAMEKFFALNAATLAAMLLGCASEPSEDTLQPSAVKAAQQRGAAELGCPQATGEVLSKHTVQEPQGNRWFEAPRRADYAVAVSGCGKRTTFSVACNRFQGACEAGPVPVPTGSAAPIQLADELQSNALKSAQQRGSKELACPTSTPALTRQETIDELRSTGWYEPQHRALYGVTVTGCGKQTAYLVECDKEQLRCATAGLQPTRGGPQEARLADELQPSAVQAAQEQASSDLDCLAATAAVNGKATIEEEQTTGSYEAPYRALYTVTVSGCGKQTTYLVTCNKRQDRCSAGRPESK